LSISYLCNKLKIGIQAAYWLGMNQHTDMSLITALRLTTLAATASTSLALASAGHTTLALMLLPFSLVIEIGLQTLTQAETTWTFRPVAQRAANQSSADVRHCGQRAA
jgi:hypothetical protein